MKNKKKNLNDKSKIIGNFPHFSSLHSVVSRFPSASTASGNKYQHLKEEKELMDDAICIGYKKKVLELTLKKQKIVIPSLFP